MRFVKVLLLIVLFTCGLLFFIQNSKSLESSITLAFSLYYGDLTWTSKPLPFFVIVLGAFASGVLLSTAYLLIERIRLGCALLKCKSTLRSAEKELARLRQDAAAVKAAAGKEAAPAEAKPA
jgi:ABC-type microcin C transport system permease subunit YejB